jgi:2-dehydro-3-deoxyphosphogluconate aldolase/(4S)-4-hydroxy-2-oxoglutarate aldolase
MPTGGVSTDKENLKKWFEAGATCVGIGSQLISDEIVKTQDFKKLENTVKNTLETIHSIRVQNS